MTSLDENVRRYYLDMMGVQCWQALEPDVASSSDQTVDTVVAEAAAGNMDVTSSTAAASSEKEAVAAPPTWSSLESRVQQCERCSLHSTRTQAITGRGNLSAGLMLVMLTAEMDAEAESLLIKMLAAINIAIDDIYITSLLKCDLPAQHTVSMSEIKACSEFLNQQIQLLQPKQLFVLGETTTRCLFQKNIDLDGLRDQVNAVDSGQTGLVSPLLTGQLPLLVSYSPQELLQQPENKRKSWSDLQQLQAQMQT